MNSVPLRICLAVLLTLPAVAPMASLQLSASEESSNWPQWRGPRSAGISEEKNLPRQWSETSNIRWKTAIPGKGHSSPIIWGSRIFLTSSVEGPAVPGAKAVRHVYQGKDFLHPDSVGADRSHSLRVLCLDRETGRVLWEKTAYEGTVFDDRHRKNTYASPTPVTDGRHVYVYFGSEGLYCYDFEGRQIWKAAVGGIAQMGMGAGTSPIVHENLIILVCDLEFDGEGSFIVALDKQTGKEVWKVNRPTRASWATPLIVGTPDRTELVVNGAEWVISYDPATGKEFWRCKGVEGHAIPSPLAGHDLVFVSAGFPAKNALAIRPGGSGEITDTPRVAWKYNKGTAYVPSPILYGEYLYLMTDKGLLTCVDALTGEVRYEGGRVPVPASFTASPVAYDGMILLFSEDGDTFLIKAGPKHEVLGTNSIGEPIFASPAISGGRIYLRGEKHLYSIGADPAK